jgi:hypothetical protein
MFLADLALALLFGLVLTGLLVGPFRRRGPGPNAGFLFFFTLLFLIVWAGGAWLQPFGAPVLGVYWMPYGLVSIVTLLLIAALVPARPREPRVEVVDVAEEARRERAAEVGLTLIFGLLIVTLLIAVAARYLVVAT